MSEQTNLDFSNIELLEVSNNTVSSFIRFKNTDKGVVFTLGKGAKDIVKKTNHSFLALGILNGKLYVTLNSDGKGFELFGAKGDFKPQYSVANLLEVAKEKGVEIPTNVRLPLNAVTEDVVEVIIPQPKTATPTTTTKTTAKK